MTDERHPDVIAEEGRPAATVVWLLYLLSIPSVGLLVIVGLIIAYVARDEARGWVRSHFDQQIRIFWQSFWWHILPWIAATAAVMLHLIMWPIFIAPLLISFILLIWFTVKSVFGLIRLIEAKPAR